MQKKQKAMEAKTKKTAEQKKKKNEKMKAERKAKLAKKTAANLEKTKKRQAVLSHKRAKAGQDAKDVEVYNLPKYLIPGYQKLGPYPFKRPSYDRLSRVEKARLDARHQTIESFNEAYIKFFDAKSAHLDLIRKEGQDPVAVCDIYIEVNWT